MDEGELKENSWRYKDGERIYEEEPSPFSRSAVSNAWEKVKRAVCEQQRRGY